jgi:FkbM family methyltransferase
MSLLTTLGKPQYLFRPRWVLRRLLRESGLSEFKGYVELPWGSKLELNMQDTVGHAIATQGLYDIITTEVIWRLTQKGDKTLDVGANIGYFTSLLAYRVGIDGRVLAFEPHPETFSLLQRNVKLQGRSGGNISLCNTALSDVDGEGTLDVYQNRQSHTSYAFLTDKLTSTAIRVRKSRGDRFIANDSVGLMKIDAQSHEASVLEGFGERLRSGAIRDIVFEEEAAFPASSHRILLKAGYSMFWFEEHLRGPKMIAPTDKPKGLRPYDLLPSYLATLDPKRAQQRLSASGWHSF